MAVLILPTQCKNNRVPYYLTEYFSMSFCFVVSCFIVSCIQTDFISLDLIQMECFKNLYNFKVSILIRPHLLFYADILYCIVQFIQFSLFEPSTNIFNEYMSDEITFGKGQYGEIVRLTYITSRLKREGFGTSFISECGTGLTLLLSFICDV